MVTTTGKVVKALEFLKEVRGQQISKANAKALFHLRKAMSETADFYMEQLNEIVERLGLEMVGTQVTFKDEFEKEMFIKEMKELENTEAKLDCEKVDLSEEDIKISEQFVDATSDFIDL